MGALPARNFAVWDGLLLLNQDELAGDMMRAGELRRPGRRASPGLRPARRPRRPRPRAINLRQLRQMLDLRVLREQGVWRLVLAHPTSAAGDGMVLAALPFAIVAAGGTDVQFSAALAVQAFTMAALLLPSGVIGDRFNCRSIRCLLQLQWSRYGFSRWWLSWSWPP